MPREFHADVDLKGRLLLGGSDGSYGQVIMSGGPGVPASFQVPLFRWGDVPVGKTTIGTAGALGFGIADPPVTESQLFVVARRDGANARGTWPISVSGSAASATTAATATTANALATGRTISLTGDITGASASWAGNSDLSIATVFIAEFSAALMMRERAALTSGASFSVGTPGTVPFGVGPVVPPGAAFAGIGPDAYNPVHLPSGSFC